ncbi:hypothetical protein HXX76_011766 [Chlamydomonas incerta]|uniref:Uncharacterized protein n=1 Tax=Chlamydomonas incerta TaxID=51695 RepID=A0A835SJ65_CHLIN|nr:hypothetical protein HXX76_011766 [Chlamydomonas incerta]|eukprot:KAG2426541.1 hypothetical protein HXX76_011766 [Chlamydomonas incerta]
MTRLDLDQQRAASGGVQILFRFKPRPGCASLGDICGRDYTGTAACRYAFSGQYDYCPLRTLAYSTDT